MQTRAATITITITIINNNNQNDENNNTEEGDRAASVKSGNSAGTHNSDVGAAAIAKLAAMRNVGDFIQRVVVANLNLSRTHEVLFPTVAFGSVPKTVTIRNVNKMIENILETASANDATIHAIIGDNVIATWNATSRVAHADVKAMRFVTSVDTLMKKEMHELFAGAGTGDVAFGDAANQGTSPFLDPHRSMLSGAVVNGAAWCQLGGSAKRQQFALLKFSEASLMSSVLETGTRCKLVAVCRTINQNCQHEFVFRGAGIHCLPGAEEILFPNNASMNSTALEVRNVGSLDNTKKSSNGSTGNNNNNIPLLVSPKPSAATATKGANERTPKQHQAAIRNNKSTTLAFPIFELCSRKKLEDEKEWHEVVGDGNNQNSATTAFSAAERKANRQKELQHQGQLATMFNELVVDVARGNGDRGRATVDKILAFDPEAAFVPAFQNLKRFVSMMV